MIIFANPIELYVLRHYIQKKCKYHFLKIYGLDENVGLWKNRERLGKEAPFLMVVSKNEKAIFEACAKNVEVENAIACCVDELGGIQLSSQDFLRGKKEFLETRKSYTVSV